MISIKSIFSRLFYNILRRIVARLQTHFIVSSALISEGEAPVTRMMQVHVIYFDFAKRQVRCLEQTSTQAFSNDDPSSWGSISGFGSTYV